MDKMAFELPAETRLRRNALTANQSSRHPCQHRAGDELELNGEFYPYQYVPIIPKNTAIPVQTKSLILWRARQDSNL